MAAGGCHLSHALCAVFIAANRRSNSCGISSSTGGGGTSNCSKALTST
jgi:hypothetical protein